MNNPGSRLEQLLDILQVLRDGSAFCAAVSAECTEFDQDALLRTMADTKTLMARDIATVVPARQATEARDGPEIRLVRDAYLRCRTALRARRNDEFMRVFQSTERLVLDTLWDTLCGARDPDMQHMLERQYGRAVQAHERIRDWQRQAAAARMATGNTAAA